VNAPAASARSKNTSAEAAEWLFRMSEDGFALVRDGRLVSVNPAWCAITRSRPLVEVGRRVSELFLEEDVEALRSAQATMEAEGEALMEHRLVRADGESIWVRTSVKRAEGSVSVIIMRDISAEHEVREAHERAHALRAQLMQVWSLHSLGQMAAMLAHELNQPLGAIVNYVRGAQTLLTRSNDRVHDDVLLALERTNGQALRAGEIIRRMRRLVTHGADRRPEHLGDVIREVDFMINLAAREAGASVAYDLAGAADEVMVDRIQVQQVIMNLVRNAMDAMADSPVKHLRIISVPCGVGMVMVRVEDSGPGVDDSQVNRLFQPTTSAKAKGMGLGLSISQAIVESHEGKIWMEKAATGGAAFCFTLPTSETLEAAQVA
jgi:two-component system sensor kinase FixL